MYYLVLIFTLINKKLILNKIYKLAYNDNWQYNDNIGK